MPRMSRPPCYPKHCRFRQPVFLGSEKQVAAANLQWLFRHRGHGLGVGYPRLYNFSAFREAEVEDAYLSAQSEKENGG